MAFRPPPSWGNPADEEVVLRELLIPFATSQLDGTQRDSDALDTKALGMLAVAAAAIALLAAAHETINDWWWLPAAGLGAAGALFIAAIWPRRFDLGPNPRAFYQQSAGLSRLDASRQMLSELLAAIEVNRKPDKVSFFWFGLVFLVVSLVGCLPVVLIRP